MYKRRSFLQFATLAGLGLSAAKLLEMLNQNQVKVYAQDTSKKLLELNWSAPTPEFLRQNISEMEQRPFDGVMIRLSFTKAVRNTRDREVFRKTAYPEDSFNKEQDDLAAVSSSRLTENFLLMNSAMEDWSWDWFSESDWNAAETNIRNFAKTAKIGNLRGIVFDHEPYGPSPWDYSWQAQNKNKSFEEYQQQLRLRGTQFIRAIQQEYPGCELMTLALLTVVKGVYLMNKTQDNMQNALINDEYGLYPSFINGILDAIELNSQITDGNEVSYFFYNQFAFERTSRELDEQAILLIDENNRSKYSSNYRLANAIYMDNLLDLYQQDPNETRYFGQHLPHFLSPTERLLQLEYNVYHALRTADKYAWVYSEQMNWWNNQIPDGAENAIRSAKTKIANGTSLEFDIKEAAETAQQKCLDQIGKSTCRR